MTPRLRPALAVAVALLLVVDVAAVRALPRPVALHGPGNLGPVIAEVQHFVERTRGLRFHRPVSIKRTTHFPPVSTGLSQTAGRRDPKEAALDQVAVLRALGLVQGSYDPTAAQQQLANDVLGVYDPRAHELRVRPGPITPRLRLTLVHELTHALDGEHHDLTRARRGQSSDEAATSFRSLAEGDAIWVEESYRAAMSAADKAVLDAEKVQAPPGVPEVLLRLAAYPYVAGRQFVEKLVKSAGLNAIDAAFEKPPTTSEQVLHADRFLRGEQPRTVVKPTPEGPVVQRGVFGELLLRLVVSAGAGSEAVPAAGTGWGGGRFVAWRAGAEVCVRVHLVMDSKTDTDELWAALDKWAAGKPRARVTKATPTVVDNCVAR